LPNLALALTAGSGAARGGGEDSGGIVDRLAMPVDALLARHGVLSEVIGAAQRALGTPASTAGGTSSATETAVA
jgi:hypothetical protein